MEPVGSKQDNGGVVNMTRAMEALSPWLNHPRRTIIRVEVLVVAAAALLLLQLILGSCRRRWHSSFLKYGLQVCTKLMDPLIIYTLGTMQSSPIKNSSYPVWAAFLIVASMGTTAVHEYDFHGSFHSKYIHALVEASRLLFYMTMTTLLLFPNAFTWDWAPRRSNKDFKLARVSSYFVYGLVCVVMISKINELFSLKFMRYKNKRKKNNNKKKSYHNHRPVRESKGYSYLVLKRSVTMDQIWDYCHDSDDGNELKELCLSYALFQQLLKRRYFGVASPEASLLKSDDFVFKKLLPPHGDSKAAFRTVEVELGFCYDFFFTKYHYTFKTLYPLMALFIYKVTLILVVGALAIRKSLVLETPNPIIEVHTSEADYIITLLVLGIALLVELVQAAFYLASDWVQVTLACRYVKGNDKTIAFTGKVSGWLRSFIASGALRKKINQYSVLFGRKDPVYVSDAVKGAIAMSLRSTYANQTYEETSLRQIKMFDWAFNDRCSQMEVMLIWHIATEYCDMSDDHRNGITHRDDERVATKLSTFFASLVGQGNGITPHGDGAIKFHWSRLCAQLNESTCQRHHQNVIATRDGHRGVAVHLSRYCAHLIGSVPELLPYHEAHIAELAEKVMKERMQLFGSCYILFPDSYDAVKNLEGTEEHHNPTTVVKRGVKLGKQLEKMADGDHWKVMEDFWADAVIHASALHYTTKQHMQRLENGGEFLTHIWALLAHAGILDDGDKDQQCRGVRIPILRVPVKQEANLGPGPVQAEIV